MLVARVREHASLENLSDTAPAAIPIIRVSALTVALLVRVSS